MKKLIILMFSSIMVLYAYKSLPSEAVGVAKFVNITTRKSDLNYISLPFDAGYTLSSQIAPYTSISSISKWNPTYQGWQTSTFIPFNIPPWVNVFNVTEGDAFCVNAKIDHSLYIAGKYVEIPSYQLITTEGADLNLIMHPITKYNLTTAGNGVGNDIVVCNSLMKWNAGTQSNITTSFIPENGWENDYESKPGQPLFVNMTDSVTWPYSSKTKYAPGKNEIAEVNLPKAVYYVIENSSNKAYDFSNSEPGTKGVQPKNDQIIFKSWVTGREDDILTDKSFGCGFEQIGGFSTVYVNLGNFKTGWQPGDTVNFEVTDMTIKGEWRSGKGAHTIEKSAETSLRGFEPFLKDSGIPIVLNTLADGDAMIPYETALYQNYPNPFNPETTIGYSLKNDCDVKLTVYNYMGQVANEIVSGRRERGHHTVTFNADMLSSGVYFYTLEADGKKLIRKMVMVR